jgi:multiple sugar transport system permease protein
MGIPREMDETAMIDGASYVQIFCLIILPQAIPALVAVGLFHFFYCWNDSFLPLIYLAGHSEKFQSQWDYQPLSTSTKRNQI